MWSEQALSENLGCEPRRGGGGGASRLSAGSVSQAEDAAEAEAPRTGTRSGHEGGAEDEGRRYRAAWLGGLQEDVGVRFEQGSDMP